VVLLTRPRGPTHPTRAREYRESARQRWACCCCGRRDRNEPAALFADELLGELDDKLSGFVPAVAIGVFAVLVFGLATVRERRVTAAA
jgi:hypothetical protein